MDWPIYCRKLPLIITFQANLGIAELICLKMEKEGVPKAEAYKKIFMLDSRGLLVKSRTNLTSHKLPFAKVAKILDTLPKTSHVIISKFDLNHYQNNCLLS